MMNLPHKPSRINFEAIDAHQLDRILKNGETSSLTEAEREYLQLMELVRGLRARMMFPGGNRIVTKAGIIKLLKSDIYGLSDWMARKIYADSLNFFYSEDGVRPAAWRNLYADRLEKWADLSASMGKLKEARSFLVEAAKLRGCYDEQTAEIPQDLLDAAPTVIYTTDAESMGASRADRKELEAFIDAIPDLPEMARARVKEDAGISRRDFIKRISEDIKEFSEDED